MCSLICRQHYRQLICSQNIRLTLILLFQTVLVKFQTTSSPSFAQSVVRNAREKRAQDFTRPFSFLAVYVRSRLTDKAKEGVLVVWQRDLFKNSTFLDLFSHLTIFPPHPQAREKTLGTRLRLRRILLIYSDNGSATKMPPQRSYNQYTPPSDMMSNFQTRNPCSSLADCIAVWTATGIINFAYQQEQSRFFFLFEKLSARIKTNYLAEENNAHQSKCSAAFKM